MPFNDPWAYYQPQQQSQPDLLSMLSSANNMSSLFGGQGGMGAGGMGALSGAAWPLAILGARMYITENHPDSFLGEALNATTPPAFRPLLLGEAPFGGK